VRHQYGCTTAFTPLANSLCDEVSAYLILAYEWFIKEIHKRLMNRHRADIEPSLLAMTQRERVSFL
jgi:hypothetical protein